MKRVLLVDINNPNNSDYVDSQYIPHCLCGRDLKSVKLLIVDEYDIVEDVDFGSCNCDVIKIKDLVQHKLSKVF